MAVGVKHNMNKIRDTQLEFELHQYHKVVAIFAKKILTVPDEINIILIDVYLQHCRLSFLK